MTTYTKETALYDTGAIAGDIQEAGAQVNKYITAIGDEGIKVHPYDATQGQADTDNYAKIDSDGMEIWQKPEGAASSVKVAEFGADGAQIGQDEKTHANVYSNSLELTDSDGTTFFKVRDAVNESGQVTDTFAGNGTQTEWTLSYTASNNTYTVTQNGTVVSPTKTTTKITFSTAPAVGDIIVVVYNVVANSAKAYDLGIRKTNTISGRYSVIEGITTTASGASSHAEGHTTTASGPSSHAEGMNTIASGSFSHSEGYRTTASETSSHAEGYTTIASGGCSHAEGIDTTASGSFSHAEGDGTTASEECSHAEGSNTIASGARSHAEGRNTTASGVGSHAEGYETTASRDYDHAEGQYTKASGGDSHAEGFFTLSSGNGSHAEGLAAGNDAQITRSTIKASGLGAHTEGYAKASVTSSSYSNIIASGNGAHAEGQADGTNATVSIIASGAGAHAEGFVNSSYSETEATHAGAHAEGIGTHATNEAAHSEGRATYAGGPNSHAEGLDCIAQGANSHAQNRGTIALGMAQTAIGKWNAAGSDITDYAFIIGNGNGIADDPNERSNAFTVDWDGNVEAAGGVAIRKSATAQKDLTYVNEYVRLAANQTASESAGQLTLSTSNKSCLVANKYDEVWSDYMNECVSVENGVVTILKSGRYRFDYQVYFYNGFTANDIPTCGIGLNGLNGALLRASRFKTTVTNPYITLSGSYTGWGEEGNTFYLIAQNSTGARGVVGLSQYTRLTVTCLMTH